MPSFGARSLHNLSGAHTLLKTLMNTAIEQYDFTIADGGRGRKEQEYAYQHGFSKVHFGDSAHNWIPWVALDIYPYPFDYKPEHEKDLRNRLKVLQLEIIKPVAKKLGIPIRQGIDFNMNGILTDDHFVDLPHVELYPWRQFAKEGRLYED